jgi:hypothetical protein
MAGLHHLERYHYRAAMEETTYHLVWLNGAWRSYDSQHYAILML